MLAERTSAPHSFVLLADDPLTASAELDALLSSRSHVSVVNAALSDVIKVLAKSDEKSFQLVLPLPDGSSDPFSSLTWYNDLAVVFN